MLLACNYSPALLELIDAGSARVDFIKCSRLDMADTEVRAAADYGPVLTHFLPGTGTPWEEIEAFPWGWLNDLNADVQAPWMAAHLEAAPPDGSEPPDPMPVDLQDRVAGWIVRSAEEIQSRLRVPLHLELVPWSGRRPLYPCCVDPAFVTQVLTALNCPLLLDTAHARVSAWRVGREISDYLQALPLDRVVEVHCSGVVEEDGGLRDRHDPLQEEDNELLAWVARTTPVRVITLEYGGTGPKFGPRTDPAQLEAQLRRLREFCDRLPP